MLFVTSAGAVAVSVIGIWSGVQLADDLHFTHSEAEAIHATYDAQITGIVDTIEAQAEINECRYLSEKIDSLEYEIYVLERDGASPDFIESKSQALEKVHRRFDALGCARLI